MSIGDSEKSELVKVAAVELKNIISKPEWANYVKTGNHKERPPTDSEWWYVRAASILKTIYYKGPIGVAKLTTLYGGRKNKGYKPDKFVKGSGSIARKILQQLEKAELIKQTVKGIHKGRIITNKGEKLLEKCSRAAQSHVQYDIKEVKEHKQKSAESHAA
jgi:small subunit ribosomal protein S19e